MSSQFETEQMNDIEFISPVSQIKGFLDKISIEDNTLPNLLESIPPIFYYKDRIYDSIRFISLQKWEGYVTEIDVRENTFTAKLIDLLDNRNVEIAEFYLEEVEEEDRKMIELGAVFYWNIGYYEAPDGRHRTSLIRFRRMPGWREQDIQSAKKIADNISSQLDW